MIECIKKLCEASGAGGHDDIVRVICEELRPYADDIKVDALGNVCAIRHCGKANAPLVMLEAHMDEIGFMVTHVDEGGFVHVSNCGGIDRRVLAATEVVFLTDPLINGVFCSTPPHLSDGENKVKKLEDMGVDVGLLPTEAQDRIPKGTRGVFRANFMRLGEYGVCVKALDDRIGCASVIEAMRLLADRDISVDVAAVFAVQEEIGGAGAAVASFALKPSAAIATDVSFASTPDAPAHRCGKLGAGPMLGMAPGLDRTLTARLKSIAEEQEIALQFEVMGGSTGTDADGIAGTACGVPTALLSIPQRYMHTPVELVDVRDAQSVARLMASFAEGGVAVC